MTVVNSGSKGLIDATSHTELSRILQNRNKMIKLSVQLMVYARDFIRPWQEKIPDRLKPNVISTFRAAERCGNGESQFAVDTLACVQPVFVLLTVAVP